MVIQTKDFGAVEISPDDILYFPQGVYAFEQENKFVILDDQNDTGVFQMQSVENGNLRFVLVDPFMVLHTYNPIIPDQELSLLEAKYREDLSFFVIAVLAETIEETTVNLKSPVVVNFAAKKGMQVILDGSSYPIRYPLFGGEASH